MFALRFASFLLASLLVILLIPLDAAVVVSAGMVYSPAPSSPLFGGGGGGSHATNTSTSGAHHAGSSFWNSVHGRGRSTSPPAAHNAGSGGGSAPQSKRDKRRTALQERLQELTASFSQNRDVEFRQQLHALQCDMTLINSADPYAAGPLPDSADEIALLIEKSLGGGSTSSSGSFAREMAGLAGTWYSRFVQEVNRAKEDRDAELAFLMVSAVCLPSLCRLT